ARIQHLKGEDLVRMFATLNIQDATTQKVLPLYQEASALEASMLNSGLGEMHPKVKALRAQKQVYTRQLEEQVAIVRSALKKNLKTMEKTRDEMRKRLDEINQKQLASKNLSANYTRAKNKYIKEKLLLDRGAQRAQASTMEMAMPRVAVSVKQVAEPSAFPFATTCRA